MKRNIFIVLNIIFLSFFCFGANVRIEKVGIINIQKVVDACFQSKSPLVKHITEEKEILQKQLDEIKQKVVELQSSMEAEDNNKNETLKKINTLKEEYTALYKNKAPEIEKMEKEIQQPLFEEIYKVVKRICETEGYTVILKSNSDAIFFYTIESDITSKVIDIFNKN